MLSLSAFSISQYLILSLIVWSIFYDWLYESLVEFENRMYIRAMSLFFFYCLFWQFVALVILFFSTKKGNFFFPSKLFRVFFFDDRKKKLTTDHFEFPLENSSTLLIDRPRNFGSFSFLCGANLLFVYHCR